MTPAWESSHCGFCGRKLISSMIPSLTVENQKPTAKPLFMRLAVSFIFVLLSVILSVFAFLLNCFHILLCDEKAERVYGTESVETKAFIEFIALILRNRLYTCFKEEMKKNDRRSIS